MERNSLVTVCSILFLLSTIGNLSAKVHISKQYKIYGTIKNEKKEVIARADILIVTPDANELILYHTITDSKGAYSIDLTTHLDSIVVKASCLGYEDSYRSISGKLSTESYNVSFILRPEKEELKEVFVVAKPKVKFKKDTVIFNLQNITNGTERVVEDILKKLPGVELNYDGSYTFKGKKVEKVLLDGDDLFDNGYTIGTKNIRAEHVSGVEAYENYTENPFLRGLEISDKVALNLNLKDGINISNKIEMGGGSDKKKHVGHIGIALSKKIKAFNYFNYNNLGAKVDMLGFNPLPYLSNLNENADFQISKAPTFLETSTINSLRSAQSSEHNNAWAESLNILPSISDRTIIRANINFYKDKAYTRSYSKTRIMDDEKEIFIEQKKHKRYDPKYLNAKVHYKQYFESFVLENNAVFTSLYNTNNQEGIINSEKQELISKSEELYFLNTTSLIKKLKRRDVIGLKTSLSYNKIPEKLYVHPGIDVEKYLFDSKITNIQELKTRKISANVDGSYYSKSKKGFKTNLNVGLRTHESKFNTKLTSNRLFNDQNDIDFRKLNPYLHIRYSCRFKRLSILPVLSLDYIDYKIQNYNINESKKSKSLLVNFKLGIVINLGKYEKLHLEYANNEKFPQEKYLFGNPILTSNRTLTRNEISFRKIRKNVYSANYSYFDLLNEFNGYLNFTYERTYNQYLFSRQINKDLANVIIIPHNRASDSYSLNGSLKKYYESLNSTFRSSLLYNYSKYQNIVNGKHIRSNSLRHLNALATIETNYVWKFIFSNTISYDKTIYKSVGSLRNRNESISNLFSFIFSASDGLRLNIDYNYSIPSLGDKKDTYEDLSCKITFENKTNTILYKLQGVNLLNKRGVSTINNSDYSQVINTTYAVSRFFLFSLEFRF